MFLKATRQLFPYFSNSYSPASASISWNVVAKGMMHKHSFSITLSFLFPDSTSHSNPSSLVDSQLFSIISQDLYFPVHKEKTYVWDFSLRTKTVGKSCFQKCQKENNQNNVIFYFCNSHSLSAVFLMVNFPSHTDSLWEQNRILFNFAYLLPSKGLASK